MAVVKLGLMPKTMAGKRLLKRLVFGQPVEMPAELMGDECAYVDPEQISGETLEEKMESLAIFFGQKRIPFERRSLVERPAGRQLAARWSAGRHAAGRRHRGARGWVRGLPTERGLAGLARQPVEQRAGTVQFQEADLNAVTDTAGAGRIDR